MKFKIIVGCVILLSMLSALSATLTEEVTNLFATYETIDFRYGQQAVCTIYNGSYSYALLVRVRGFSNFSGGKAHLLTLETETVLTLEAEEDLLLQIIRPWAKLEIQARNAISGEASSIGIEKQVKK